MDRPTFVAGLVTTHGVRPADAERAADRKFGRLTPAAIIATPSLARQKPKPKGDGMNKTERRRAIELDVLQRAGEIRSWVFEDVTLRLAHNMRLTPDFFIEHNDGSIEFEEIKGGFIREDSWLKLKMAARLYPMFTWTLRQWKNGRWHVSAIPQHMPSRFERRVGTALEPISEEG